MERGNKPMSECCDQEAQGAGEGEICVEIHKTNDLTNYESLNILHNYETDFLHTKDTSDVVLEVDHQIKEKLTVGGGTTTTKSPGINGCLVNGMTKLDEERIKTIFHCNNQVQVTEIEEDDDEGIEKSPSQETVETLTTEEEENCDSGVKCLSSSHSSSNSQSTTSSALCSSSDGGDGGGPTMQCEQSDSSICYIGYESELQMPDIMRLIQKDLSEPYSIYTYRYFIHNWPKLCFLAMDSDKCVGAVVCKLDLHKKIVRRGYIAMLAVDENYRKRKIGSNLVLKAIRAMVADDADEVVLETEITNKPALRLYENLGFVRDKRLFRYYLNGVDALRLKLWLR